MAWSGRSLLERPSLEVGYPIGYHGLMRTLQRPCETCGETYTAARSDALYCSKYCKLKAFRHRHSILQARADRALRSCLKSVSGGRLSGAAAKAKLGLYDLSGIRIDKDLRKIIDNL